MVLENLQPENRPDEHYQTVKEAPHFSHDKSRRAITIEDRNPMEVYLFWRDFQNISKFMQGVSNVQLLGDGRSKWKVLLNTGIEASWEVEIIEDQPGVMISWQSLEESEVTSNGAVWFSRAPQNSGTVVSLTQNYSVPGGKLTEILTMLRGEDPDSLTQINLRRLKSFLETGEIPTIEGQPSGRDEITDFPTTH
jgi:uncharacterized membrane protein